MTNNTSHRITKNNNDHNNTSNKPKMMTVRTIISNVVCFRIVPSWFSWAATVTEMHAASFSASGESCRNKMNQHERWKTWSMPDPTDVSDASATLKVWNLTILTVWWCLIFIMLIWYYDIANFNDRSLTQNIRIILKDRKSASSHQVIVASTSHEQLCVATWSFLEMHVHRYNKGRQSWVSPLVSGWETWLKPSHTGLTQKADESGLFFLHECKFSKPKFKCQVQISSSIELAKAIDSNMEIQSFNPSIFVGPRSACRSRGSTAFNCGRLRSLLHCAQVEDRALGWSMSGNNSTTQGSWHAMACYGHNMVN